MVNNSACFRRRVHATSAVDLFFARENALSAILRPALGQTAQPRGGPATENALQAPGAARPCGGAMRPELRYSFWLAVLVVGLCSLGCRVTDSDVETWK